MDSSKHSNRLKYDDEISLLDLLVSIKRWGRFFIKHKFLLLFCALLGVGGSLIWRSFQNPVYQADLTLMLNDDSGSSVSGLTSILGQFGIPAASGKYNIDKLLEISRSRTIVEKVLFQKIDLAGREDFIANHFLNIYPYRKDWTHDLADFEIFEFKTNDTKVFSVADNFALKKLFHLIVGTDQLPGMLTLDYGREHYIMTYSMTTLSDTLSIEFIKRHFDAVKEFYIEKATEKQQVTYDLIAQKRDSILQDLGETEIQLANTKDRGIGSFSNQYNSRLSSINTKNALLKASLAKVEENLALAELALENKTPLIQLLDAPIYPLSAQRPSIARSLTYGLTLGVIIFICLITYSFLKQLDI